MFFLLSVSTVHSIYPWLIKVTIDRQTLGILWPGEILGLAIIFALNAWVVFFTDNKISAYGMHLRDAIRANMFYFLLNSNLDFHRCSRSGDIHSKLYDTLSRVTNLASEVIAPMIRHCLLAVVSFVFLCIIDPVAGTIAVIILFCLSPLILRTKRRIQTLSLKSQHGHAISASLLSEALTAIREVISSGRSAYVLLHYKSLQKKALEMEVECARQVSFYNQVLYAILSLLFLLSLYYAGQSADIGLTKGESIAFFLYLYTLTMALTGFVKSLVQFDRLVSPIVALQPMMRLPQAPLSQASFLPSNPTVTIRNLSFVYPTGQIIFDDFSISIEAGQWIVISGSSGSGKSTLAGLMMGLYTPQKGDVYLDGIPITSVDQETVAKAIGFVGQESFLFYGTLRENIIFFKQSISEKLVQQAVSTCLIDEFIDQLPLGLDTIVGEHGYTLSGGQRSRIALARAIVYRPPIVILDEPTVALDPQTETRLYKKLLEQRYKMTTIIFTHRTEAIPYADRSINLSKVTLRHRVRYANHG
jgi:ABC-type bacteriocin/lantibiotic exporter with double-glycine peptidase domain